MFFFIVLFCYYNCYIYHFICSSKVHSKIQYIPVNRPCIIHTILSYFWFYLNLRYLTFPFWYKLIFVSSHVTSPSYVFFWTQKNSIEFFCGKLKKIKKYKRKRNSFKIINYKENNKVKSKKKKRKKKEKTKEIIHNTYIKRNN